MDPEQLALINRWLAGRNAAGNGPAGPDGATATDPPGPADQTGQQIYWPDSWSGGEPSPQDHAAAMEILFGRPAGPDNLPGGSGAAHPANLVLTGASWNGGDPPPGAAPPAGSDRTGGEAAGRLDAGQRLLPDPYASPSQPLAPAVQGLPQLPSQDVQDAAGQELMRRGVNPNADYYPSENDALANLARGRAAPAWDRFSAFDHGPSLVRERTPRTAGIGSRGYVPAPGDENMLARMIFAESSMIPDDYPAVGWAMVNRVGLPEFGTTLDEVRQKHGAFQIVPAGGGPPGGSLQWRLSGDPSKMNSIEMRAWRGAQQAAHGILTGSIPDPTGGSRLFFSSDHFNGDPDTAPGDFRRMLRQQTIRPSSYQGHGALGRRNYFFVESQRRRGR